MIISVHATCPQCFILCFNSLIIGCVVRDICKFSFCDFTFSTATSEKTRLFFNQVNLS
jgi:hypothetical protein